MKVLFVLGSELSNSKVLFFKAWSTGRSEHSFPFFELSQNIAFHSLS